MPFIDFAALKAALTIEQVVTLLGLKMQPEGNQFRSSCPACKTTGGRELVVTPSKGAFYCFSTKKGGDLIALAAHIRGESAKDAAAFLLGTVTTVPTSTSTVKVASSVPTKGFDRAKYQNGLVREHELLKDVPADVIQRADLGVSTKGSHKGLVNIPIYDKDTHEFICYVGVPSVNFPTLKTNVVPLKAVK